MPWVYNVFTDTLVHSKDPEDYVAKNSTGPSPTWSSYTDMPTGRRFPAVAADSSGNIYVAGGYHHETKFEIYDAASETWSTGTDVPTGVYGAMAVCDSSDNFHLIGGHDTSSVRNLHQVWNGSSWTSSGALNTARYYYSGAIDDNDNIYVSHGHSGSAVISSAEKWSPSTSAFSTLNSASVARRSAATDILNGNMYVICGANGGVRRTIEAYNIASGTWSDVTPSSGPPTARYELIAVTLDDDKIHIMYGYDGSNFKDIHETWDGTTCTALTASATSPARAKVGLSGQTQESTKKAYVVGGYSSGDLSDCDVLTIFTTTSCYPIVKAADCTSS